MQLLQENPDLTQRELAEKLGVSVGGVNYCLKALVDKGWVKMKNFAYSKNKFGYVYVLTPHGLSEKADLTARFLKRKMDEYEMLKHEIEALKAEIANINKLNCWEAMFNKSDQLPHRIKELFNMARAKYG